MRLTRRDFLAGASSLLVFRAVLAQARLKRVGILNVRTRPADLDADVLGAFVKEMRQLGHVEGRNVQYEWRFAEERYERLPALAASLVEAKVDVILAATTPPTRAAQKATSKIPIVMAAVADPLGSGLVASLARPGGNITGVTNFVGDTSDKQFELIAATFPKLSRLAVLANPDNPTNPPRYASIEAAARAKGVRTAAFNVRSLTELEKSFADMKQQGVQAVLVLGDSFFYGRRGEIAQLALQAKLPSIYAQRQHAEAGGLMSYGASIDDVFRRAAVYVDKILKGARPADLPVEQPSSVEFVINMKTAQALGVVVHNEILVRANAVIR